MSTPRHYYTKEGFEKAKKELRFLQTKERSRISQEIGEARSKGDLSENAEYHIAKEAQEFLEKKIAACQLELAHARIIRPDQLTTLKVSILSIVKLKNKVTEQIVNYTLVPQNEANLRENKLSVNSPIGKGLLGKKVGEIAIIKIPAGTITLEVLEIKL